MMSSVTLNCSPKTFSPRVLIHRTDYSGVTKICRRGETPSNLAFGKSFSTLPFQDGVNAATITNTEEAVFKSSGSEPTASDELQYERINIPKDILNIKRNFQFHPDPGEFDQRVTMENDSNSTFRLESPLVKKSCKCCRYCTNDFRQLKDIQDLKTILPQILKINDKHFYDKAKGDSLRWTLFNSSILRKNLFSVSCNDHAPFGGPLLSNHWIYPDLESYARHLLKEEIINGKTSNRSISPLNNNTPASISYLSSTLPIPIGSTTNNSYDVNNNNSVFLPLLSRNTTGLPIPSCSSSLSFSIPSTSSTSNSLPNPPHSSSSSSSSVSSVYLFRRESLFTYDHKPMLSETVNSSPKSQEKLKRASAEGDDVVAESNKHLKISHEKIPSGRHHFPSMDNEPFMNSVTDIHNTKHKTALTRTSSIYRVPKDSLIDKRQIQKTKNFHCPFCKISCSNRGQLQGHVRIHTGERPFVCQEPQCGKAFIRNEELTRHRRIHTGERPHICSVCMKAFTRKDHLSKHMKTHS